MKSDQPDEQVPEQPTEAELLLVAKQLLVENKERLQISQHELASLLSFNDCRKIKSDGSTRRFWRLGYSGQPFCIIVAPEKNSVEELAESKAAWKIGRHLFDKDIGVPELYGWDEATGILLFEDLGDSRLHDLVLVDRDFQKKPSQNSVELYQAAIDQLAVMQCKGADGFDRSWCWAGDRYDFRLMTEMESGYFLRAFWQGFLGRVFIDGAKEEVETELADIARLAAEAPANFFMHRDFQSRNIMIKESAVRIIDFQGGRLGPLAYDLASLLIDPYCKLPSWFQEELVERYLQALGVYLSINRDEFKKQFSLLAFQRNMQIVGAFSFLYKVREKRFFLDFIKPSVLQLKKRLEDPLFADYSLIRSMVNQGIKAL